MLSSGATTLIISNDEMDYILIVKYLENFGVLLKGVSETIQHEAKFQIYTNRSGF